MCVSKIKLEQGQYPNLSCHPHGPLFSAQPVLSKPAQDSRQYREIGLRPESLVSTLRSRRLGAYGTTSRTEWREQICRTTKNRLDKDSWSNVGTLGRLKISHKFVNSRKKIAAEGGTKG
jgi:hypothetical protein